VTTSLERSEALHAQVRSYARDALAAGLTFDAARFEQIALEIAEFQRSSIPAIARLYQQAPRGVDELKAAPTDLFRLRRLAAHEASEDVRCFRTSGTTAGASGFHPMRTLTTYLELSLPLAEAFLFPQVAPEQALVLAPSSSSLPESSLSFMIDRIVERRGLVAPHLVDLKFGLNAAEAEAAVRKAALNAKPTAVFGTSFAFVYLLDQLGDEVFPLAAGSVVMLTGGFKGRTREVPEAELRERMAQLFGLTQAAVVGEYGMTELTSQLYEPSLIEPARAGFYRPPPWARVWAADPDTLAPLPAGQEGVARIVDLGNVDSSVAVQTLDWVRVEENGDVKLFGRAKGAALRGCSLLMEQLGHS
jgi:hypothetical protein